MRILLKYIHSLHLFVVSADQVLYDNDSFSILIFCTDGMIYRIGDIDVSFGNEVLSKLLADGICDLSSFAADFYKK